MRQTTRRVSQAAGGLFLVIGIFWAGRESAHGLAAFWEHWWCPIPLALTLVGVVVLIVTIRRTSPSG